MAPIDIVQAQAEVASNEERVIVAEAAIKAAQDSLRALILDPATPDFWNVVLRADRRARRSHAQAIDVDAAVRNALDKRSDLRQREEQPRAERHQHQVLPQPDHCRTSTRNVDLHRDRRRRHAAEPGRLIAADHRPATATRTRRRRARLRIGARRRVPERSIRTGPSACRSATRSARARAQANLARARLQYEQAQTQLKNIELQVATQVRDAARKVQTNQQRVAVGARVARAAGEEARGGGEEARRRHVDELLRVPGAARSVRRRAPPKSRRSPTTTSRWSTSRRCSRCRSTAAAAALPSPDPAPIATNGDRCRTQRHVGGPADAGGEGRSHRDRPASACPSCPDPCPSCPTCPSCPQLHSPRAEALGHGHHQERSGGHRRRAGVGRLGRRDRRRRLREHRRHRGDRAAVHRPRRRPRVARLRRRRRTTPRRSPATTGFCRSTPTSASRRSWPPRSRRRSTATPRARGVSACRA